MSPLDLVVVPKEEINMESGTNLSELYPDQDETTGDNTHVEPPVLARVRSNSCELQVSHRASALLTPRHSLRPAHFVGTLLPFSRTDVLYNRSITRLASSLKSLDKDENDDQVLERYRKSVIAIPNKFKDDEVTRGSLCVQHLKTDLPEATVASKSCMRSVIDTLHLHHLVNADFQILALNRFLAEFAFYVPYTFLASIMGKLGMDTLKARTTLGVIGIANAVGKASGGLVLDHPAVDLFVATCVSLVVVAGCIAVLPFCASFVHFVAVAIVYGYATSFYVISTPSILVSMFGMPELGATFGLQTFFRGIASLCGPVVVGYLYDQLKNYTLAFLVCALCVVASSLVLMVLYFKMKRQK